MKTKNCPSSTANCQLPTDNLNVLTVAGFDPSGGAGLLADVKVFEQHGLTGLAVNTANTYQNDTEFDGVDWMTVNQIEKQLVVLLRKFEVRYVKIGLIENLTTLKQVIDLLEKYAVGKPPKIIWDPILKASAGFEFHQNVDKDQLTSILKRVYIVTPNLDEANTLFPNTDWENIEVSPTNCNVLLKGGHGTSEQSTDVLYTETGKQEFVGERTHNDKHGTGCVLSAAIIANLAGCFDLPRACLKAKEYVTQFIASNNTMLGNHKRIKLNDNTY
ncbi:MAG: hydroxymethylpyrimidine/phosphomethylpyrimidine kinase [Flavobacteriales bacterium]